MPDGNVTELHDIDVHEVSLVDAPAIRRKFLIIKREDAMSDNVTDVPAEEAATEDQPIADEAAVEKADEAAPEAAAEEAAEEAVEAEVEKGEEVVAEEAAEEAVEAAAEEAPVVEEVEKAKRVTASRLNRLNQMYKELGDLLKELSPPQDLNNAEGVAAPQVVKAEDSKVDIEAIVKQAVAEAIKPLLDIPREDVAKAEDAAEESADEPAEEQAEESAPQEEDIQALRKRLSELEATSSIGGANTTDTIQKNATSSIWAGIV